MRYELADHLGNTRVSFTAAEEGVLTLIEAHDHYPHGGLLPGRQLTSSSGGPLAYQGQEYDTEVNLTAFNLRQYDARLGRWQTPDPYGQHYSPYLAMGNNPVMFVDPDGGYSFGNMTPEEISAWERAQRDERTAARWAKYGSGISDSWSGATSDSPMLQAIVKAEEEYANWMRDSAPRRSRTMYFDLEKGDPTYEILGGYGSEPQGSPQGPPPSIVQVGLSLMRSEIHDPLLDQIFGTEGAWRDRAAGATDALYGMLPYNQFDAMLQDALSRPGRIVDAVQAGDIGGFFRATNTSVDQVVGMWQMGEAAYNGDGRAQGMLGITLLGAVASQGRGGRLGNPATRLHVQQVATSLRSRGWSITGGGGVLPEEFLRGPFGSRLGGSYPDITAIKNGRTLRINTVDTRANGITPTFREAYNARRIRSQRPNDHLLLIPKP